MISSNIIARKSGESEGTQVKAAVVLSGCGYLDGTEITEVVATLVALDRVGVETICCAPKSLQHDVVDHTTGDPVPGKVRDALTESARIAREGVRDLGRISAADFDMLVFPGGFGAAKNLSSFAKDGAECKVHPDVERLILETHGSRRSIALACIAPVLAARVLGARGLAPLLTIGNDPGVAGAMEAMGARHQECGVGEVVVDEGNRLVSTPAYMLGRGPAEVFDGIGRAVDALWRLATVAMNR